MRTDPIMPPILFDGQEVRMVTVDGDARLVGNDVARRWAT
jgi:prophage antirepressor-like protein